MKRRSLVGMTSLRSTKSLILWWAHKKYDNCGLPMTWSLGAALIATLSAKANIQRSPHPIGSLGDVPPSLQSRLSPATLRYRRTHKRHTEQPPAGPAGVRQAR